MSPQKMIRNYRAAWFLLGLAILSPYVHAAGTDSDAAGLDELQRRALNYFWEGGHRPSGLAYEASYALPEHGRPLAVGGSGFGVAALVAGVHRGWVARPAAVERLLRLTGFIIDKSPRRRLHGALPHWLHEETGEAVRFSEMDDGADLVETAFMIQGLLLARAYFNGGDPAEEELRRRVTRLWEEVEWDFFTNGEENGLYWHWSPNAGFGLGMKIQGFNECLIAYVLALSSPTHPISVRAFSHWSAGYGYQSRDIQGYRVRAALPGGGPLFLTHYSFIGLDPAGIADAWVSEGYLLRNIRQTLANRGYCLYAAPAAHGYGPDLWGLTASMTPAGYAASDPAHDHGVVAPTAALSAFPYAPHYAFEVLATVRRQAWGRYGPYDALGRDGWHSGGYLAIDQLPIVAMVENYRSGLLWRLFMGIPEIRRGLARAGLTPPRLPEGFPEAEVTLIPDGDDWLEDAHDIRPHPDTGLYSVPFWCDREGEVRLRLCADTGREVRGWTVRAEAGRNRLHFPPSADSPPGKYVLWMTADTGEHRLPVRLNPAGGVSR